MIQQERVIIGGKEFLHTYSNEFYILQNETGIEYEDAMDLMPCSYTYSETSKPLHQQPELEETHT